MYTILPLITLLLLFLLLSKPDQDWRISYLSSVLILGSIIAVGSEIMSLPSSLNFETVLIFWLLINLGLGIYYSILFKKKKIFLPLFNLPKVTILSKLILLGTGLIVLITGLVGIIAPPNNWDSMTYHMPRVMHWIQNQNLAHYPTYYSAQLVHPPFAEVAIMHLQILSGGDRFANWVQWLAMINSIIGVSLVAKELGAKEEGQLFASAFCASIPMGILQASSTQNDYVVAFWILCLAYYTLALVSKSHISYPTILAVASSLGLALYTKSSAYVFTFPFIVWICLSLWQKSKWKELHYVLIIIFIAGLFNWGHFLRNMELFGSPISAADYKEENQNSVYSLPTLISTVIRNLSAHVDIVRYFHLQNIITPINGKIEKLVYLIHERLLHLDPSDPRTTMPGYVFRINGLSFNEDVAINPYHYFLIITAIFGFVFQKKLRKNKFIFAYFVCLISGFLLFSVLLKIQPYSVRHHLNLFVLFSPFVAISYSVFLEKNFLKTMIFILIITCTPWLFNNQFRPLIGENSILKLPRNDIYFLQRKHLKNAYQESLEFLSRYNCTDIGLSLGWNVNLSKSIWEYPFWSLMSDISPDKKYKFFHLVNPENSTAKLIKEPPYDKESYCALIAVRASKDVPVEKNINNNSSWNKVWSKPPITILIKK